MTIKAWVNPPVSLSLKEIQDEFGCLPGPPTTTTTRAPQTSTTTSTTSTSTSTSTTLAPLTYNPTITIAGLSATLKAGSSTTYEILGFTRGPNIQYQILGGPPGASFSAVLTFSNSTTTTISDTVPSPSGNWTSATDSSASIPLGLLTVVVTFTPLVGQTVTTSNTRTLEVTVLAATTTSTTAAAAGYFVDFFNDSTNAAITSANEGDRIRIVMRTANVPNGTSVPYIVTGISQADLVGSPALSGTFVVGSSVSVIYTISADLTSEGVENLVVSLGNSPTFLGTGTLAIQDTSATQSGTAILTLASGSIETLTGSATLPSQAVRLMFRLIGAGGSGGGADAVVQIPSSGGTGGGGGVLLGMVDLPATTDPKILKGGLGLGGQSAESVGSTSGLPQDYGLGGIGFSFPSGSGYSARGGNGATDGPRGVSGRGGGGGGATALLFTTGTTTVGIASAAGGGGGGGASYGVTGGHAQNASGVPIAYQSASLNGVDAVATTDDGGGGGGGGGGAGAAGTPGRDQARGNQRALGGTAGNPVQNTSLVLSSANWARFEYVQPRSTAVNGVMRVYNSAYIPFLNTYGVYDNFISAGTFNVSVPVYFPVNGTYNWFFNMDNTGSFSVDNVVVSSTSDHNQYTNGNLSGTINQTIGWKTVTLNVINTGGPGAVALLITDGSNVIFSTLDLLQNRYAAVESSVSGNRGYYGTGGFGSDSVTNFSTGGTNGAIAIYWTTDTSAAWNPALLPELPLPTFQLTLPSTVDAVDYATIDLYINGRYFAGTWGAWATFQYNDLGRLYQVRVDPVSGDDSNFCPSAGGYITKATWTDWNYGAPIKIGRVGDGTTVAKISIRRKSDNVVQFEQNTTFTYTSSSVVDFSGVASGGK